MQFTRKISKSEHQRKFIYFNKKYEKYLPPPGEKFQATINDRKIDVCFDLESRIWLGSKYFENIFHFEVNQILEITVDVESDLFVINTADNSKFDIN